MNTPIDLSFTLFSIHFIQPFFFEGTTVEMQLHCFFVLAGQYKQLLWTVPSSWLFLKTSIVSRNLYTIRFFFYLNNQTSEALSAKLPTGEANGGHLTEALEKGISGIDVDRHTFSFDGILYLNFSFDLKDGGTHQVEYEPVLPNEMNSNILVQKLKISLNVAREILKNYL